MKNLKLKILMVLSILISQFGFAISVFAAGTCTLGFGGNSSVQLNNNITVTLQISNVSNVPGGISSVGGYLVFDSEYLEYVSGTGATTPYSFQINESIYKIAGLDISMSNGISSNTTVFTFVFKAKKAGTTTVSMRDYKLTDTNSGIVTTNLAPKQITITDGNSGNQGGNTGGDNTGGDTTQKSSDATLKSLGASGYDLEPSFSPNQTSYTVTVPKDATYVTLTGTANDSKATVSGLGNITLTGDETTATITVTAEDGTKKTYTVKIVKDNSSSGSQETENEDATLKSLEIEGQTLSPSFKSNVNTYSVKVKNDVSSLDITAIPTDPDATVEISSNANNLKEGMNTVTIKVTTKSGKTNVYTINVERASSSNSGSGNSGSNSGSNTTAAPKSSDNTLSSLVIGSSHDMDKNFDKNITSYNITVPYDVDHLDLSAVASSSKAKVQITGNENFKVGQVNVVTITVTAEDGSQRIYILNVTRSTLTSETDLGNLEVKEGISPSFTPDNLEYFTEVDSDVDHLDITAIPKSPGSTVEIIGNSNLKEGDNTIFIKVTDKNGFSKIYRINVKKAAASKKIFGLTPFEFGMLLGLLGLLFLLLFLLFLFFKRKKKEEPPVQPAPTSPVIDFKPEFNFGSRNGTDDDIVYPNATFNQGNTTNEIHPLPKKEIHELDYKEAKEIPYDMYDEVVTKDELIDAIEEGLETKNLEKLQMLLEQEKLNRRKEELKMKDQERR